MHLLAIGQYNTLPRNTLPAIVRLRFLTCAPDFVVEPHGAGNGCSELSSLRLVRKGSQAEDDNCILASQVNEN